MTRPNREQNLGLRIGDTIIHCNEEFTIIDIRREENSSGMRLFIHATDAEQADKLQQDEIKHSQIGDKITELFKKITEKGLGGLGM